MIPSIVMSDLLKISKENIHIADYLATYSPYLNDLWTHHGAWIAEYSDCVPADIINNMMQEILDFDYKNTTESDIMRFLRLQKHRSHLLIALCDIFGDYPVHTITQFLSDIATLLIELSFKYAVHDTIKRGKLILPQPEWGQGTGLIVCGMGKLGAFELNYSSDIDICVFFDTEALPESDPYMLQEGYIKVTQNIVKLLSHQTADGYVYRTDLRLRPDPASTKVAISLRSAEQYYEQSGQNWERAAWIKARFICGDPVSWVKFQTMMRPFIWRKSLDYAAIQDIQSIKRQLHSHYKQQDIKVSGHDIKIGRGGIREIELFCQTQQLIGGGRDLRLRVNTTFDALDALVVKQWVTSENADILKNAYCLFRKIEHRLQMVSDMQTHLIPTDEHEFEQIAKFCDYKNSTDFTGAVTEHLNQVVRVSNSLFAKEKPLAIEEGNLVFTGHDDDPSTLKTLENMGFKRPEYVTATVRKWHGAYRAMRSSKARELLTEITPIMLKKMVQTHDADTAIMKMDDFLEKLPSGVGFFSYLLNNDALLDLMIDIMGSAPDLADFLARYPETFDIMSDANFYNPPDNIDDFKQEFSYRASTNIPLDKVLNLLRRFNREQKFRIGIAVLRNHLSYGDIGKYFSALAQCCLELVVHYVIKEFCDKNKINQQICEKNFAIIAMGSFGADEMNAASDLDLLMVYDADSDESIDNPAIHYNKLGQRLISALTLHTQDGILYDVDMRLRPSGHSGSLVVSVERFENYQKHDAHIWEHLALMRARPVMGTDILKDKISKIIHTILSMPKDKSYIKDNVHDMREKLLEHRKALNIWDIKLEHGGIFDISFIAQTLGLIHAEQYPDILHHNTLRIIEKLYLYQIITHNHFEILSQSWDIFQKMLNLFALTKVNLQDLSDLSDLSNIPTTLKERIAHILNLYDESDIKNMEHSIKNIYFSVQSLYKIYIH